MAQACETLEETDPQSQGSSPLGEQKGEGAAQQRAPAEEERRPGAEHGVALRWEAICRGAPGPEARKIRLSCPQEVACVMGG